MEARTEDELHAFLKVSGQFQLGDLFTEQPHPLTQNLSEQVLNNAAGAVNCLKAVDTQALDILNKQSALILKLASDIAHCWDAGGCVFLAGCGATGRLSIALETLLRESAHPHANRLIGFMAGGDAALIRSIEAFEDHPEYGARQLDELGFREGDMLVGITEGGETPHVIGATEHASQKSTRRSWFCYCNPDKILTRVAKRSARVLQNNNIPKLNLCVGAMAISGSTRMQASTVQMAAVGLAALYAHAPEEIPARIEVLRQLPERIDASNLARLIQAEAQSYQNGEYVLYETQGYGITVLTDTTERSPTFSLTPFENEHSLNDAPSLCYLKMMDTACTQDAWEALLKRKPRCLEWDFCRERTGVNTFLGFNISSQSSRALDFEKAHPQHTFSLNENEGMLCLNFKNLCMEVATEGLDILGKHLLAKLILNTHSTLVMGLLGRYEGNLMTYVRPSNLKLIDRTIRYVQILSEQRGNPKPDYETCARAIFELRPTLASDEPTVLRVLEKLSKC